MIRADRLAKFFSARELLLPAVRDTPARRARSRAGQTNRPTGFAAPHCNRILAHSQPQTHCGLPPKPDSSLPTSPLTVIRASIGATPGLVGRLKNYRCPFFQLFADILLPIIINLTGKISVTSLWLTWIIGYWGGKFTSLVCRNFGFILMFLGMVVGTGLLVKVSGGCTAGMESGRLR